MSSPSKSESSKEQSPSLWAQIEDTVERLCRDTPQDGWHRLKWTSAFGKALYMEVKAKSPGEMDMLCMQFSGRSPTEPSQSSESTPTSPNLASPIGEESPPRQFLLLVISTMASQVLKQIDVTDQPNSRELFTRIRDACREANEEEILSSGFGSRLMRRLFGGLSPFRLTEVNLASFHLIPLLGSVIPTIIRSPALPPREEVVEHQNWAYSPFPRPADYYKFGKAFLAQLNDPRHAYLDQTWTAMLPKKLNTELAYEPSKFETAWGVHLKEGLDTVAVYRLMFLLFVVGWGGAGLYAAITGDVRGGLGVALWVLSCSTTLYACVLTR